MVEEQQFNLLFEEIKGINRRLDSVDQRFDRIENRLEKLEVEQQQIKQTVLETNEHVKRLEGIQESQHRMIELLSARSIQQEDELKRIK